MESSPPTFSTANLQSSRPEWCVLIVPSSHLVGTNSARIVAGETIGKTRRGKGGWGRGQGDRLVGPCFALPDQAHCTYSPGTTEDVERFSRRTVKVTREHNEECRRLLKLMGIPVVVVWINVVFFVNACSNCLQGTLGSRGPMCRTRAWRKGTCF